MFSKKIKIKRNASGELWGGCLEKMFTIETKDMVEKEQRNNPSSIFY